MESEIVFNDDALLRANFVTPGYYKELHFSYSQLDHVVAGWDSAENYVIQNYPNHFSIRLLNGFMAIACAETFDELKVDECYGIESRVGVVHSLSWTTLPVQDSSRAGLPYLFSEFAAMCPLKTVRGVFDTINPPGIWLRHWSASVWRSPKRFVRAPEINHMTVSYGASGRTVSPGDNFYGVIKDTGYDFWVLRKGVSFNVVNAGVFVDRLDEFLHEFSLLGRPPDWCDYLTVSRLPSNFYMAEMRFNRDPAKRASELFAAILYRRTAQVVATTVPVTVPIHRKNMRRFLWKIRNAPRVCTWCEKRSGSVTVSCAHRDCKIVFCVKCEGLEWNRYNKCPCGRHRTFEWWHVYDLKPVPCVDLEVFGDDSPGSLTILAAGAVRRGCRLAELTREHLPANLLALVRDQGDRVDYWSER